MSDLNTMAGRPYLATNLEEKMICLSFFKKKHPKNCLMANFKIIVSFFSLFIILFTYFEMLKDKPLVIKRNQIKISYEVHVNQ